MKKLLPAVVAILLICTCCVGGTYALLTSKTTPVVNSFTYGKIGLSLDETLGREYLMVPGAYVEKDPMVTVLKDSEACYLFIRVDELGTAGVLSYEMADGWNALNGQSGIYWRLQDATTENVRIPVLKNNRVLISDSVKADTPTATLNFVAYAIQQGKVSNAAEAWSLLGSL